jgi:UrcA family protein
MAMVSILSRLSFAASLCGALGGTLAVLTFPTGSAAREPSEEPTAVRVSFKGLDLSRPADAAVFLARLHDAALEACGGSSFSAPGYIAAIERSACFKTGVSSALDAVHAPQVSRVFRATLRPGQ